MKNSFALLALMVAAGSSLFAQKVTYKDFPPKVKS
jgi:hypothetical protein